MEASRNFVGSMFDFSFSEFITTKIVKFLYILAVAIVGLVALAGIIAGFSQGAGIGILALLLAPVYFMIMLIAARIWLELVIVVFRIAENVGQVADHSRMEHHPA